MDQRAGANISTISSATEPSPKVLKEAREMVQTQVDESKVAS